MNSAVVIDSDCPARNPPLVSVVISTCDRAAHLANTLAALRYLRYPRIEVIVVQCPCGDDTPAVLESFGTDIKILSCDERNLSKSRNIGISRASGGLIAFIDDDAIPEPDWLDQLVPAFDDPRVAAAGGFIRDHTGVTMQARYVVADLFGRNEQFDTPEQASCIETRDALKFFSLTGTNSIVRRACLEEIGGFDENFAYFLDETDVNLRLVRRGFINAVVPGAEVHHKYAESHLRTRRNVALDMFPICKSMAYFAIRHALPRLGWPAVHARLRQLERDEVAWKNDNLTNGDIDAAQFHKLVFQIKSGIRAGIAAAVHTEETIHFLPSPGGLPAPALLRGLKPPPQRLRLAFFSQDQGAGQPGGIARWTRSAARGLAAKGHEITVIGRAPRDFDTVDFADRAYWSHLITTKPLDAWEQAGCLGLPQALANYSRSLRLEIDRTRPRRRYNIVSGPIWEVEPAALIGQSPVPVCLSLHTTAEQVLESKPEWRANRDYLKNHVQKLIGAEKSALLKADALLANSRAIVRDCEASFQLALAGRAVVVPHGIEDCDPRHRAAALSRERARIRILFVGRIEHRKGFAILAQAAERLLQEFPAVVFDVVGHGVDADLLLEKERLHALFPHRFVHHGYVAEAALEAHYQDADIFVAPSRYESFGLIFLEAMRYAIPCAGTWAGGIPEVVLHGETGLLSPPGDAGALYQNLRALCEDRELRRKLGAAGRRRYEAGFTVEAMCDGLEAFYRSAVERFTGRD